MFSIIVPLYNKQNYIKKTIESVLKQTFTEFELIIVDDGSYDDSVLKVKELNDDRIKLVLKENGGVNSARNCGIELAKFLYIALLDADDYWEPEYLLQQSILINKFPDASIWSCAYGNLIGDSKFDVDHVLPKEYCDYVKNYFEMKRKTDLFCSSSVIIRKSAFETTGYFDTRIRYSEDLDMWYRIIINFPVVFYNKTLVYYRQDAENRALLTRPRLKEFLPYYVDKYNETGIKDQSFLQFINNWSAIKLFYYYFDTKLERNDALEVIKKIDFTKIKWKYTVLFKTPYMVGLVAYRLMLFKKLLWLLM